MFERDNDVASNELGFNIYATLCRYSRRMNVLDIFQYQRQCPIQYHGIT